MIHCTANIGWYIGKFVLSVSAILFVYWGFLKEEDIECYCGAIDRESRRESQKMENNREKLQSRCVCRRRRGTTYACGCERDIKPNAIDENDQWSLSENDSNSVESNKKCCCSRK